ncbi:MAG: dihydrofolate reductase [Blastocatellia bacterium]|nr:dihydrofolate reductase [Blastocatellia bacterium]
MILSLIAAMDRARGIGIENRLPWRLPADLKRFRELTMGHHIILGRKTFESIGRPLPGRQTIIVSRDPDCRHEGCLIAHSIPEALELARARGETEAFICGGAEIYRQTLTLADRLYLTLVDATVEADAFFPAFNESEWIERERLFHSADEKNPFSFEFLLLERK